MIFYKYQGAGNDFLIADNRKGKISLTAEIIANLCDRRYGVGADGLMLLETAEAPYDFRMTYYNSDGSGGMMCGNGGRCIVAFAKHCGIRSYDFIAADGPHHAEILSSHGKTSIVKLKMKDVDELVPYDTDDLKGMFLDTGTRHFVAPVQQLDGYDVVGEGRRLRWHQAFAPVGVNVNFIQPEADYMRVRTFEKGVEDETFACGTGITASCIAHWHMTHGADLCGQPVKTDVRALRDALSVEFVPTPAGATDVYLIGPATFVAKIIPGFDGSMKV